MNKFTENNCCYFPLNQRTCLLGISEQGRLKLHIASLVPRRCQQSVALTRNRASSSGLRALFTRLWGQYVPLANSHLPSDNGDAQEATFRIVRGHLTAGKDVSEKQCLLFLFFPEAFSFQFLYFLPPHSISLSRVYMHSLLYQQVKQERDRLRITCGAFLKHIDTFIPEHMIHSLI